MPSPHPPSSQLVLDGKYRLDGLLGEGAVGDVYRATHLRLQKSFALKLLKPGLALDPFSRARFEREAEALGRLRHPNIVTVTDSGIDPGSGAPYLVMELLEGVPLSRILDERPLPLERALPILEAIAEAVDAAHAKGILHRDLKPGNVLLCGAERTVKVLDFGLAEISGSPPLAGRGPDPREEPAARLTATGDLPGTPLYVAPELIRGDRAGRASDLYSFAVIAYELLTGEPPFRGSIAEVLSGHLEREPPRSSLSPEIWRALRQALAKDPEQRPKTAREIVRGLRLSHWRHSEVPRRAFLAFLLAAAVPLAALSPHWEAVERWAYDLRLSATPSRAPDPRILLVSLDDDNPVPLADRADEIGETLDRVLSAGARGVAIDVELPGAWKDSPGFSNLVLRHPDALTLAARSRTDGTVSGAGCVSGLTAVALGPEKAGALFGFVNLDTDADGAVRHGRLSFRDREGGERPSWAARAAGTLSPLPARSKSKVFWIDHRIDPAGFASISWKDLPAALAGRPGIFRDRLVLVGGDLVASGDDVHRVPGRRFRNEIVSGLMLQARVVDTLIAGLPVREPRKSPFLAGAALWSGLAAAVALLAWRPFRILLLLLGGLALYLVLSITIFQSTGWLLPAAPLPITLGAPALALTLRRALPAIPRSPTE